MIGNGKFFVIFRSPTIRKMSSGERKESAWRSITFLFVLTNMIFLCFLEVSKLEKCSRLTKSHENREVETLSACAFQEGRGGVGYMT